MRGVRSEAGVRLRGEADGESGRVRLRVRMVVVPYTPIEE